MEDTPTLGITSEEAVQLAQAVAQLPAQLTEQVYASQWRSDQGRIRRVEWPLKDLNKLSEICTRLQALMPTIKTTRGGELTDIPITWRGNSNPNVARMGKILRSAESRVKRTVAEGWLVDTDWMNKCLLLTNPGKLTRQVFWTNEALLEKWGTASLTELGVPTVSIHSMTE